MHQASYLFNCVYNVCTDAETHFLHVQVYEISSVWQTARLELHLTQLLDL